MTAPAPRPPRPFRLAALALAALLAGCASDRGPAEQAIATVETAYAKVRSKARALAPERAAEIERQLDRARLASREGDWVNALAATTALPGEIEQLAAEIERKEASSRASWDSTNTAIAARLQEVDAAIGRVTPRGERPAGIGDGDIARANDELAAARIAWSQAIAARENGAYDEARVKVGEVQLRARRALSAIGSP